MTTVFHARPYGRFMEIFIIIISLFIADKIVKYWLNTIKIALK